MRSRTLSYSVDTLSFTLVEYPPQEKPVSRCCCTCERSIPTFQDACQFLVSGSLSVDSKNRSQDVSHHLPQESISRDPEHHKTPDRFESTQVDATFPIPVSVLLNREGRKIMIAVKHGYDLIQTHHIQRTPHMEAVPTIMRQYDRIAGDMIGV